MQKQNFIGNLRCMQLVKGKEKFREHRSYWFGRFEWEEITNLPQPTSSEPSPHSLWPLHFRRLSKHRPFLHRNSPGEHSGVSTMQKGKTGNQGCMLIGKENERNVWILGDEMWSLTTIKFIRAITAFIVTITPSSYVQTPSIFTLEFLWGTLRSVYHGKRSNKNI